MYQNIREELKYDERTEIECAESWVIMRLYGHKRK
jgi:hypothetical protein